jgi:membrane protein YdbS with pleckstrin-like domain
VAYPDDLLSQNEHVVVHGHPHFKMLIVPTFFLIVTIGVGIWLAVLAEGVAAPWHMVSLIAIAVIAVLLVVWLFVAPLLRSRCRGSTASSSSTA